MLARWIRTSRLLRAAAVAVIVLCGQTAATPIYEVAATVDNSSGAALTDHQVSISLNTASLIAAGKLQADGGDLRITDASGASLCHFLQGPLNDANTIVWLKLPSIPAGGTVPFLLYYGDPSAASADNPSCTFDYWEGFDDSSTDFSPACGDLVWSVSGGLLFMTWSTKGLLVAAPSIPLDPALVAEADVTATTGRWPGLHWFKAGTQYSYAVTFGSSSVRISTTPASTSDGDRCAAHNWASSVLSTGSSVGIWSLAWPSTGSQEARFPGAGAFTAASAEHLRDTPLQLALGGIATSAGGMTVNWIRTRRYAAIEPTVTFGSEHEACGLTPSLCNDSNACTADACVAGAGCSHTAIDCNDATVCTIDTCDTATGCVHTAINCNDSDACTMDSCDAHTGCLHPSTDCDDANACTNESCSPTTGCAHVTPGCEDHNACTTDVCDVTTGCAHPMISCDDHNACTLDTCDPTTGCVHTPLSCDDTTVCTVDSCDALTGCQHATVDCNDSNACTTESCNAITGCQHAAVSCDDHTVCTTDACDVMTGCAHTTVNCDDHDVCFDDTCDALTGCAHTAVSCDDASACTTDACDAVAGCSHAPVLCDDGSACTMDTCDRIAGCLYEALDCDDHNVCNVDSCDPAAGCHHARINCDDDDACTADVCDPTDGCAHDAITCDDHNDCTADACLSTTGCVFAPRACNDHDVCTDDTCTPSLGCQHDPIHGPSFPSIGCRLDWLREDVRTARTTPAVSAWFGRRIDKARIKFNFAELNATSGDRIRAAQGLRAVRILLRQFLERAHHLSRTGRLREPDASGIEAPTRSLVADVHRLLAAI